MMTKVFTLAALTIGFALSTNAQACSPAPVGLVSWYSGDGNALDSRSRNNGTLQNGATFASGNVGQAFDLDGVNDSVSAPDSPSLRPVNLTIEGWFRFDSTGSNRTLISKQVGGTGSSSFTAFYLPNQPQGLQLGFSTGIASGLNNPIAVSFMPTLGQWNHLAFTFDDVTKTQRIYINGSLAGSNIVSNSVGYDSNVIKLGMGSSALFFDGGIDEVSIYDRSLLLSEIQAIMGAGTAGKCKPTATVSPSGQVGWWSGDGNTNDIAGANNGTLLDNASFAIGKVGQAFNFDGTDDRIEIPNNAALSPATISLEAWVKPSAINLSSRVISKDISSVSCVSPFVVYSLETRGEFGGKATLFYTTTDNVLHVLQGTTAIPLNVFSHISGTFDGTTAKIYVNGVLENSQAVSGTIRSSTTPTIIGNADTACRGIGGNSAGFNGIIDEPSIYNRAITQDEVTSIFNAGIAGKLKQNATINSSSLVSLWQGEGNANDTRGANNGTLLSGTTFAAGKIGQALSFDGVDDAVSTSANAFNSGVGTISVEAWVNPSSHGTDSSGIFGNTIISNADGDGFALRLRNGVIQADLRLTSGNVLQTFGSALPLNQFSHVAITYDGTNVRAFLNGVQTGSNVPATGTIRNTTNNGICLMIGNDPGLPCVTTNDGFDFHGLIDEAAIYNRALLPTEIRADYEAGNAISTVVGDARVTFPTVSTAGNTQQIPLDLSTLPGLPIGVISTGLAYDIATTATFTGSPQVCFNLPAFTPAQFIGTGVLHLEAGVWVNRTATSSFPNLCTTGLTSFSPFAIVRLSPTAANVAISGRVTTTEGRGIRNARLVLTSPDGARRTATTSTFGYYAFDGVEVGQTYVLEAAAKRFTFANPTRVFSLQDHVTGMDFAAEPL